MKKNIYMFMIGFILLTFFMYCYREDFNLYKIATDSGFDTSYGSGGSSGGSSWGGSSSSSSSYGGSSSVQIDINTLEGNLTLGFVVGLFFLVIPIFVDRTKYKKWTILVYSYLIVCILLKVVIQGTIVFMASIPVIGIILDISESLKRKKQNSLSKREYLPKTEENIKLLEEAYNIFVDTQMAWMNFDYDKLRDVTTDDLYNTYYNQLQTLKLKEQTNVMSDFELIRYELIEKNNSQGITTIKVELEVKFYDYISNNKGVCIKGDNDIKVHMLYDLTYVYNEKAITECPNCNAPLSDSDSICSHCNANIPSVRGKMKLSTKKCIKQM